MYFGLARTVDPVGDETFLRFRDAFVGLSRFDVPETRELTQCFPLVLLPSFSTIHRQFTYDRALPTSTRSREFCISSPRRSISGPARAPARANAAKLASFTRGLDVHTALGLMFELYDCWEKGERVVAPWMRDVVTLSQIRRKIENGELPSGESGLRIFYFRMINFWINQKRRLLRIGLFPLF